MRKRDKKFKLLTANRLFVKIRWYYVASMAITGGLTKTLGLEVGNQNFSSLTMFGFAAGAFAVNLLYYLFLRKSSNSIKSLWLISMIQIAVDLVLIILIIFLAGGIISVSFFYFTFAVIASGFFFGLRGVILVTAAVSVLYAALIWGQYFDIIPYLPRYNDAFEFKLAHNPAAVAPNTFTIITTFFIIGFFVSTFSRVINKKEEEIIIQKEKESAIIANLSDGIINLNNENKIDVINSQAENILSIAAPDVKGKSLDELDKKKHNNLVSLLGLSPNGSCEFELPTNPDLIYSVLMNEINDENGKVIGKIITIHDISHKKFIDRVKSEFITIASHQLRTPLTGIRGGLELLRTGVHGKINKQQKNVLDNSYEYSNRLLSIINDLLNASSVEASQYNYEYKEVDILELLKGLGERFAGVAEKRKIKVTVNILNNISKVLIDSDKMRLALGSIVNNAVKYSPNGSEVTIKCAFENDKVLITVIDRGIGIPQDAKNKIFTKFFRAKNAFRTNTEGNGLDLYVAKTIIVNHQGRIWFESAENKGTKFYIELRIKPFIKP